MTARGKPVQVSQANSSSSSSSMTGLHDATGHDVPAVLQQPSQTQSPQGQKTSPLPPAADLLPPEAPLKQPASSTTSTDPLVAATAIDHVAVPAPVPEVVVPPPRHGWRFWAIMLCLGLTGTMSAIEGTIITSALPTITAELGGGNAYIWVPNAYLLAQVAVLPLFAQASDVFGRRPLLLGAVAVFTLGSGLSGGARTLGSLIAARTVQGLGGGGILLLIETIVTDLVPLRERGTYMALVGIGAMVGATMGPFLGGLITDRASWRWCFYLNVPIGAACLAALWFFLRVKHHAYYGLGLRARLRRVDVAGNAIFMAAVVAVLLAVTWGGTVFGWASARIVVPLVLGFVGIALFTAFEWTPRLCPEPSFPRAIVANRTSAVALLLTFLHAIVTYWTYYFLPLYFQAVRAMSPLQSGVSTLPTFAGGLAFALVGGLLLTALGRYRLLHAFAFAVTAVSFGLLALLDAHSSKAAWVCFQLLCSVGTGGLGGILLPAVQAPLDERHVATATGVWSFARYFGCVWGVTIPSAIFNNEVRRRAAALLLLDSPDAAAVARALTGNRAYEHATATFVNAIADPALRARVVDVFAGALRLSWLIGIAFGALGFVLAFVQRDIELRRAVNSEFGMEDVKKDPLAAAPDEAGHALGVVGPPADR